MKAHNIPVTYRDGDVFEPTGLRVAFFCSMLQGIGLLLSSLAVGAFGP